MVDTLVELKSIRKTYGNVVAVDSVNLSIARGEFVVLLGPSGSGKTTILSMLGGFATPSSGEVLIDGADVTHVPPALRPTVTVFQDYALFPHMSVASNVSFGLAMRKVPTDERRRRAEQALRLVGLEGFGDRSIDQLSGGQRQRVALARAIAVEPTVLLLDEPLGALDLNLRRQMQEELVHIQKQLGTTFVHVTHDQDEAMSIADTIVVLNHGKIEDNGPPDRIYLKPASLFTATFMGESNILEGTIAATRNGRVQVSTKLGDIEVKGEPHAGDTVHLSIRPEHIKLGATDDNNGIALGEVVITEAVFQGAHRRCRALAGTNRDTDLLLRIPVENSTQPGDTVEINVQTNDIVLLRD
ncbi:MAG: ABC transporter ATP-binding protein [Gammaproteobacteria bacterium]|nr:ABC transporter ATP-binding protein [Gammaproteobacteria bacterium]